VPLGPQGLQEVLVHPAPQDLLVDRVKLVLKVPQDLREVLELVELRVHLELPDLLDCPERVVLKDPMESQGQLEPREDQE